MTALFRYLVLNYFGNPSQWVILFMLTGAFCIFTVLSVHMLLITFKGLRIFEEYFILPNKGIYSILTWGSKPVWFKDINLALLFRLESRNRSYLKITLNDGQSIVLCERDIGIDSNRFNNLLHQIDSTVLHQNNPIL